MNYLDPLFYTNPFELSENPKKGARFEDSSPYSAVSNQVDRLSEEKKQKQKESQSCKAEPSNSRGKSMTAHHSSSVSSSSSSNVIQQYSGPVSELIMNGFSEDK